MTEVDAVEPTDRPEVGIDGVLTSGTMPVTDLIRAALPRLSPSLARVADVVLTDPLVVAQLSADQLAERAQVSQASVTRFCQSLGLPSYQSLLLRIAQQSGQDGGQFRGPAWETTDIDIDITPEDDLASVVRVVASADVRGIQHAADTMDLVAVESAASWIGTARTIDVYGIGSSGLAAQELEMMLFRIGFPVRAWLEVHAALVSASLRGPEDLAIAFSESGRTRETFEALERAKQRGARTIAITRDPGSPIARLADLALITFGGDAGFRIKSFASRHAQMLMIDVLYVRLAQIHYDLSSRSIELTSHIAASHAVHRGRRST